MRTCTPPNFFLLTWWAVHSCVRRHYRTPYLLTDRFFYPTDAKHSPGWTFLHMLFQSRLFIYEYLVLVSQLLLPQTKVGNSNLIYSVSWWNFCIVRESVPLLIILKQIAWREGSTTAWSQLRDQSWTSLIGRNNEKYDKILHRRMELSRYHFNSICMCSKDNVYPDTQLHSDYEMTYQDQKIFLELEAALSFRWHVFIFFET